MSNLEKIKTEYEFCRCFLLLSVWYAEEDRMVAAQTSGNSQPSEIDS